MLDFLIAALSFTPLAVLLLQGLQTAGILHPERDLNVRFTFSRNWSASWLVACWGCRITWATAAPWVNGATGIRAVSLVHERLCLWRWVERAGLGASALEWVRVRPVLHSPAPAVHPRPHRGDDRDPHPFAEGSERGGRRHVRGRRMQ